MKIAKLTALLVYEPKGQRHGPVKNITSTIYHNITLRRVPDRYLPFSPDSLHFIPEGPAHAR